MTVPMIVDSHCHLDMPKFGDDLDEVVARARRAGIARMVTISTKISTFPAVLAIAERYDDIYCSVGVHPHDAGDEGDVTVEQLVEYSKHPKVVGIGESGLDYHYEYSPRDDQKRSFRTHIEAARKTGLPLIVHTREAEEDTMDILEEEYAKGAFPGLIHCFTSSQQLAERAVKIGFPISISGIVTFKNAEDIRDTVRALSIDDILVETDAPFLAPIPMRGKRNEPAFVAHVHAAVAELKGLSVEECAQRTTGNFLKLFSKVSKPEGFEAAA